MKTEMEKLIDMLKRKGLPFQHEQDENRNQVLLTRNGKPILSVICHFGSYGYEQGLLEIAGDDFLTKEELKYDSVVGYLTADHVMARIEEAIEYEVIEKPTSLSDEQMKLVIKAEHGIKAVADYLAETRYVWDEMRNLKLYKISSFTWQHADDYPDLDLNNEFQWFCEDQYMMFEEWAKEEGIELRKVMKYIGRTSSFYLTDISDSRGKAQTKIDGNFMQGMYEQVNGGYGFSYMEIADDFKIEFLPGNYGSMSSCQTIAECFDEEKPYLEYLADTETPSGFLGEVKYFLEDAVKVADYIDDTKENQVEYFKEQLQCRLDDLAYEKQCEHNRINEIVFGERNEELAFIAAGGIGV